MANKKHNKVTSANARRTFWFHAERHRPGIAEFSRQA